MTRRKKSVKKVLVPKTYQPPDNRPKESLAYISPEERRMLLANTDGMANMTAQKLLSYYMEGSDSGDYRDSKPSDTGTQTGSGGNGGLGGASGDGGYHSGGSSAGQDTKSYNSSSGGHAGEGGYHGGDSRADPGNVGGGSSLSHAGEGGFNGGDQRADPGNIGGGNSAFTGHGSMGDASLGHEGLVDHIHNAVNAGRFNADRPGSQYDASNYAHQMPAPGSTPATDYTHPLGTSYSDSMIDPNVRHGSVVGGYDPTGDPYSRQTAASNIPYDPLKDVQQNRTSSVAMNNLTGRDPAAGMTDTNSNYYSDIGNAPTPPMSMETSRERLPTPDMYRDYRHPPGVPETQYAGNRGFTQPGMGSETPNVVAGEPISNFHHVSQQIDYINPYTGKPIYGNSDAATLGGNQPSDITSPIQGGPGVPAQPDTAKGWLSGKAKQIYDNSKIGRTAHLLGLGHEGNDAPSQSGFGLGKTTPGDPTQGNDYIGGATHPGEGGHYGDETYVDIHGVRRYLATNKLVYQGKGSTSDPIVTPQPPPFTSPVPTWKYPSYSQSWAFRPDMFGHVN